MKIKVCVVVLLAMALSSPGRVSATVCHVDGFVQSVIPSEANVGVFVPGSKGGCSCAHDVIWISTENNSGRAMYAAVLSAKLSRRPIKATIFDGVSGDIAYRYPSCCKLMAFEVF